jgi:hypothetical protein
LPFGAIRIEEVPVSEFKHVSRDLLPLRIVLECRLEDFDIFDPIILDDVRQGAEEVVAVLHALGEAVIDPLIYCALVHEVRHFDAVFLLPVPLDAADPLFQPGRVPRQVHIDERCEGLEVQTLAGRVGRDDQTDLVVPYGFLDHFAVNRTPLAV